MRKSLRANILSSVIVSLILSSTATLADEPVAPPPAKIEVRPVPDKASNFVHCDGQPNKESSLSTAARLVALSLVVGLFIPMPESADTSKRMKGQDGIKACDAALNGDEKAHDGGRRLELILGRSIHRMEIADWQGAIDDLHTLPADQPELTGTRAYRQSLGQTAAYLEGISLVAKGDTDGAVAMGYRIANDSPYDAYSMPLAYRLVLLEDGYTPEKKQILDQMVRINPKQATARASARALAGDFAGAADDYAAYNDLLATFPETQVYVMQALGATSYRLAGNAAKAEELMTAAKLKADSDATDGKRGDLVDSFHEISDFYDIVAALDAGQSVRARNMFSAHSHWRNIGYAYVAELARRLQTVGTPEEQAMSPIQTPDQVVSEFKKTIVAAITSKGDKDNQYWSYFIPANGDAAYARLSTAVWNTKRSPYIVKTKVAAMDSQYVSTSGAGVSIPCGYAMYMHLAVTAKAQGKTGFMMMPGQKNLCEGFFRIGNADDKGMVAPFMMNADQVIADLGTYFPKPVDMLRHILSNASLWRCPVLIIQ